jgi:hypothetical protein
MSREWLMEAWATALQRLENRGEGRGPLAEHIRNLLKQMHDVTKEKPGFILDTIALDKMAGGYQKDIVDRFLAGLKPMFPGP